MTNGTRSEFEQRIQIEQGEAARRTFEILTAWALDNPDYALALDVSPETGKLQIEFIRRPNAVPRARFQGETFQDACAQAAQTIQFDGVSTKEIA